MYTDVNKPFKTRNGSFCNKTSILKNQLPHRHQASTASLMSMGITSSKVLPDGNDPTDNQSMQSQNMRK